MLTPDTVYDIRINADGQPVDFKARTRNEVFPIGKTTHIPGGQIDQTLLIKEGDGGAIRCPYRFAADSELTRGGVVGAWVDLV